MDVTYECHLIRNLKYKREFLFLFLCRGMKHSKHYLNMNISHLLLMMLLNTYLPLTMANYRTLENDLIEKLNQRALLLEDSNKLSKLKHNIAKNKFLQHCKQKNSQQV